jgi:hypothetical protein
MISATPIDMDMIAAVVGLCFGTRDRTQMVSTVVGTDPAAKSPATRQSTLPFLEWIAVPSRFRYGGVKQVGSHRRERMDAEKQYQQRRHQRTATHAGQTHDGATGERIEPVHGRYNSALVHHWDMIRGSDGRASMLDGGLSEFVLAKGTCRSQRTSPPQLVTALRVIP